ncbi:MAG: hypothetical protein DELT_01998 [Desulfovibrio sp.]
MSLAKTLEKETASLAAKWANAADAVYPFASAGFLRTQADPFANPVGRRSREVSEILFRAVLGLPHDGKALRGALEEFVRVRAMQDVGAETSLAVMFAYKSIVRAYLAEHTVPVTENLQRELDAMDERCDTTALLAFGIYARAREAFYNARLEDYRRRNSQVMRLAKRHGLVVADDATIPDTAPSVAGETPGNSPGLKPGL